MLWSFLVATLTLCSTLKAVNIRNATEVGVTSEKIERTLENKCLENVSYETALLQFITCVTELALNDEAANSIPCAEKRRIKKCWEDVTTCLDVEENDVRGFSPNTLNINFENDCDGENTQDSGPEKSKRGKPSEDEITPQKIEAIVQNKCLRNANADAFTEVKNAVYDFTGCMIQNIQPPKNNDDIVNTICTKIHENGYKCLKDLVEKLEPCLALEEKYLPKFLLGAHNSSFEQECEDGRRHLQDKIFAMKSVKCNPAFELCMPKINLLKNLRKPDYVITKGDLCSDIETAKECTISEAVLHCKDDTSMVQVVTTMFDQFLKLCNDDVTINLND